MSRTSSLRRQELHITPRRDLPHAQDPSLRLASHGRQYSGPERSRRHQVLHAEQPRDAHRFERRRREAKTQAFANVQMPRAAATPTTAVATTPALSARERRTAASSDRSHGRARPEEIVSWS